MTRNGAIEQVSRRNNARFAVLNRGVTDLNLEAAALSASASSLEFAALGAHVRARVGVRLSGGFAEVSVGRAGSAASLHENGVLSLGGFESQLIEGHDFASGLEDALAGVRGDVHGAERQLGKLVNAQVVGDGADNHGGLVVTAGFLHHARDAGDRHGWPVHAAHIKTFQDDLVELGVGSAGQETVELDQEAQVDILAFRLRSAGLPHVLVTDVDSHLDSKLVLITTF